jgi:4'-phosphopantetheinyl transferase
MIVEDKMASNRRVNAQCSAPMLQPNSNAALGRDASRMTPEIPFDLVPKDLDPSNDEVHIICASLDQSPARMEHLAGMLSADERARAARFHFDKDKKRFAAGRGMLREILGWLLRAEPAGLVFSYGPRGKPRLAGPTAGHLVHFNLAHADSLVVYAVSRDHEIGVDIERVRPLPDVELLAAQIFSKEENEQWQALPVEMKTEAFFTCWTSKEACLKANGEGISGALHEVEVSLTPGEPAQLVRIAGDPHAAAQWCLHSLSPAWDYTSVVALNRPASRISCWKWEFAPSLMT